ncbi:RsmF rRNA methyltransferase first C-terminal domain-containing protein [Cellulosilyticum ruminicola]|uniref:RsmF rRNA methyltransferase first C-terminal domain-containing protein n=1 Tax=Cellulosilyticum ruminicola TaxID=425254 RepID=UPI0006D2C97B|nr:RsmB/NOP family class I SAM-dependent RNA methyltransferase [Cellulosilyticum ruminicola]
MQLPQDFKDRMQKMLGEEFEAFLQSYTLDRAQSLRVNTLKVAKEDFMNLSPFHLRQIPWVNEGFYYNSEERPGKHVYHEAGLYYIQEPSAMAVATLAEVVQGERVLDLCAAPGGKSTQLAAALQGKGMLISNEIHPVRAKILAQNIERMGILNAIVTNETPQNLAKRFPEFFDRIVVDAPCSGEGMFRKDEEARNHWSIQNVEMCALRQAEILDCAAIMLRPGGTLVYSTCTFAPEENERSMANFVAAHPEFEIKKVEAYEGFAPGRPEWADGVEAVKDTFRLWPHLLEGEGHYVAVLQKSGAELANEITEKLPDINKVAWKSYETFAKENLVNQPEGYPVMFGEQLYLLPYALPLRGLKVVRAGLHLGTCKKKRFEPSHALALALRPGDVRHTCKLTREDARVNAYLKGETITSEGEKGWHLVCVDGYALGWGKLSGNVLKNHYPKGLRWM